MSKEKNYIIPFKGLSEGLHEFSFHVKDDFFDELEYSEIKIGDLNAQILLIKRTNFLELEINIKGWVNVTCDVCLDEFKQDIEFDGKLFVKFGEEPSEQEDIIIIPVEEHEIDLSHYIYESINLSIPYKKVHPEDEDGNSTCNKEMLQKLKQHSISEHKENNDPRWDKLKDFLSNN